MADLSEIPAIIREYDPQTASEMIENLQRENLNPMEEADGYRNLMELYALTQEQISEKVGKSRSAVANALRLLTLKEPLKALVREGKISAGHARALLSVANDANRMELAKRVIDEGLSVRALERLCAAIKPTAPKISPNYEAELRSIEKNLSDRIGAKVHISGNEKKGKIEIRYTGNEEFQRIMEIFGK